MSGQGEQAEAEIGRHRHLSVVWTVAFYGFTCLAVFLSVNQLFNLGFFVGYTMLDNHYQYALVGLLVPLVFLIFPAHGKAALDHVPWYDVLLFFTMLVVVGFFLMHAEEMVDKGWEMGPSGDGGGTPQHVVYLSYVLWAMLLEVARRTGGTSLFAIVALISFYPVYADKMPQALAGLSTTFGEAASYHTMSSESMLGIPMRALANLVLGFLIFGVALQHTGGGKFFINLAFALLGHVRGGPAKVAIFASGLMGSMSGSVITNVLTTGVLTIPAMKRNKFSPAYAGGVEACASTGGVLMPPVMGSTAFIMATFLEVKYITIAIAAIIPSVLYFFGLFMQIDAYAARNKMPGMDRSELPSLKTTLRDGWYFIAVFVLLVVMLVYMKREALAPYYATVLLIGLNQTISWLKLTGTPELWGKKELKGFVFGVGSLLAEITGILAAVGLIIGALSVTGVAGTLVNELLHLAGGSTLLLLLMGAITSFIMGIGMTVTAAYIFLAVLLAPALIEGGLDPMAVHLFILYWGMVSFITPPVALGAFAAATLAGASPMRTGFEAMRLGSIIYFIPFFFVLNPAFIGRGTWPDIILLAGSAVVGVVLLAGALQGYLIAIGDLGRHPILSWVARGTIGFAGLLLATPGGGLIPFSNADLAMTAAALLIIGIGSAKIGAAKTTTA